VAREGLADRVSVDSAGTGDWHLGHPPHEGTRRVLDQLGISYTGMKARKLAAEDAGRFDFIVAMDTRNERDIRSLLKPLPNTEILRFLSLIPERGMDDVPDPYFTGNFEEVYELVKDGCERLLSKVKERLE
jgi:protein-tyrosine phosphatase